MSDQEISSKDSDKSARVYKRLIKDLIDVLPETTFVNRENVVTRDLCKQAKEIVFNVDYNREDSWLIDPVPSEPEDKIGVWDNETKYPSCWGNVTPSLDGKKIKIVDSIPYEIKDTKLSQFFKARSLASYGRVSLPNKVFDKNAVNINKNVNFHTVDFLSRKSLLQNLLGDGLVGSVLDLMDSTLKDWSSLDNKSLKDRFIAIKKTLKMTYIMNQRCRQYIVATYTNNKMKFRNYILDMSVGSEETKRVLRGSSLFSATLFGDIPESFKKGVDSAYHSGRSSDCILKIKSSGPSKPNESKKGGYNNGGGPSKRPRTDYLSYDRPPYKTFTTPRNMGNELESQNIFREDRKNSYTKNNSVSRGKRGRGGFRGSRK